MPVYQAEVEVDIEDLTQRIQDRWWFEAADVDEAKAKAEADFAERQTVHPEGILRITDEAGKSYERPFPVENSYADWS